MAASRSVEQPLGFPKCKRCPLRKGGSIEVCYRCANASFTHVKAPCGVCTRETTGGKCGNPLCADSNRSIECIDAVAVKTGALDDKIKKLKYGGKTGWATIFGRVVAGYLDSHCDPDDFDLIIPNPTFIGPGSHRQIAHAELVIEAAGREDTLDVWPFDSAPWVLQKTGPTPASAAPGSNYWGKVAAADALLDVLYVADPDAVRGARVLVYDDVCTTGHQLDRVAQVLKRSGAASVEGLVLARTPWRR